MEYIILPFIAAGASLLTFFSGFGLGTILTPVFAVFFPVELAVTLTAIVHFLNGLFKLLLVGKFINQQVLLKFGLPAILAASLGAWLLTAFSDLAPLFRYHLMGVQFVVTPLKLLISLLIAGFTLLEILPVLSKLEFGRRYLAVGGLISGFFGGLSGHQGALRSAFLARAGLSKEQFVGTGSAISLLIDLARMTVYFQHFSSEKLIANGTLLLLTTAAAFIGALLGNRLLKKITMAGVQKIVSIALLFLALALGAGWI